MNKKVTGIVAYITIIGWLIAFLAGDKENAKFHLNQALVVALFTIIVNILGRVLAFIPIVGGIVGWVLSILALVAWILGFVYAIQDAEKEIPVLGSIKILK